MKKRYILYIVLVMLCLVGGVSGVWAQMRVSAPSRVSAGENFRITYTLNTDNVEDFRLSGVPEGLECLAGPFTSTQASYQVINGHTSSSSSTTITYVFCATKDGTFTVPAAHARVNGKNYSSNPVRVAVAGRVSSQGGTPRMHQDEDDAPVMQSPSHISGNDLFIKVSASKRRVYEQEPVLLTYKVYTRVDLTQLEGKMPDLTGFHTQEIPLPQQKSFKMERVNGVPYRAVTWSQYVMYPQMTGKLQIPSITFKGIVVQQNRAVDPFEAFLNGGSGYVEVKRNIQAPGLTLQVDPLPTRPANFSGGVGKMNISAQLAKKEVKAGDPITLRVVIGGTGNLKLIKLPEIPFPKEFDHYDPKITDKTKLTSQGVTGNMVYDIMLVPRSQGRFTVPAVEFCYFDVDSRSYKTLKTQPFVVNVEKGDGRSSATSYEEQQDNDIHALKTESDEVYGVNDGLFFGSVAYWVALLIPLLAFIVLLIVFRRRALERADIIKMRSKNADKVARRRLNRANKLMFKRQSAEFYDEVLRALWDYAGYKLNMPVENLTRENIAGAFASHGVQQDPISKFISALDTCEFERYAPGDAAGNMEKTYTTAVAAISEIEEVMKKKR